VAGRTLVVTNDFPPRVGGIESFVLSMVRRLPPEQVVYVGDRADVDAPAAEAAGMPCFILTTAQPAAHQSWTPVSGYAQLLALLQENSH